MGDGEDGSSYIFDAAIHLAFFVRHDPESRYLLGQPVRLGLAVSVCDADQQEEAWAYRRDPISGDRNGGFFDALEDYAQGL